MADMEPTQDLPPDQVGEAEKAQDETVGEEEQGKQDAAVKDDGEKEAHKDEVNATDEKAEDQPQVTDESQPVEKRESGTTSPTQEEEAGGTEMEAQIDKAPAEDTAKEDEEKEKPEAEENQEENAPAAAEEKDQSPDAPMEEEAQGEKQEDHGAMNEDDTNAVQDKPEEADDVKQDAEPEEDANKEVSMEEEQKSPAGDAAVDLSKDEDVAMEENVVPKPSTGTDKRETPEVEKLPPGPPAPPEVGEKSAVETATSADIVTSFREEEQTQPLSLDWTFGFNRHIGCLNLSDNSRSLIMYASAHVAVLYDCEHNLQKLLLGHANALACMSCSSDKRWLVTADKGPNSSIIVWDSYTGIPVQTMFNMPGDNGTVSIAMSPDAKYVVSISAQKPQIVAVWDWTTSSADPVCSVQLEDSFGRQAQACFHPSDNMQFVSNSDSQVLFFYWGAGKLVYHAPYLSDDVFNRVVGLYSQSVFKVDSKQALTGTSQGNIVVWDPERAKMKNGQEGLPPCRKRALKLVRLQDRSITTLTQTNGYIVTGDVSGNIKFYDNGLNLINWYNKGVEMGPLTAISFKHDPDFNKELLAETGSFPKDATIPANAFIVRDFAASTKHAEIFNVNADGSGFARVLAEHDAAVHAIATSPTKPWICIGSFAGLLKIWNYETKQCVVTRVFDKGTNIQCLAFDPSGLQLAIGMTNGTVHVLDSFGLTDEIAKPFRYARDSVTHIAFSHNSKYLATADADLATTVFEYDAGTGWRYLGRYRAHYKSITDLAFGVALDSNMPRLLTLGEDRTLVEYDLEHSSKDDLRLTSIDRIEQSAVPNCITWYPNVTKESFLLTANDQYKFKLYNTTTKMCRKTLLGPTYGSSIRKLQPLPADKAETEAAQKRLMAYITKYKVGLQILPLDGNPHKSVALVGHPSGISHLTCSHDGKYLFTSGGKDACVHMWSVSAKALEAAAALGGEDLDPFYGLLEGGRDGELFAELENYFYFAQLRSQGLDTTEMREVSTVIPLEQIPFVMRALGFYPSEQEIEDMLNEVKFSEYVETGKYVSEIDLGDFIKLYVNHRPAFGLSPDDIQKAFDTLGRVSTGDRQSIGKTELYNVLQRKGEHMTEQELSDHLATLLGLSSEGGSTSAGLGYDEESLQQFLDSALPEQINAQMFSEEILGLPVYDMQQ